MVQSVAVVTGAGSGIGRACALSLGRDGFVVVLAGRRQEQLESTAAEGALLGMEMDPMVADVSRRSSVSELFSHVRERYGRLDLLFNNAGISAAAVAFEDLSEEQWSMVIDTNLNGAFYCAQEAFKLMKQQDPQGGRIINNGSLSAHVPRPSSAPYTASKHAITGLTKSISLDGRKYGITCGQIDIGNALSEMVERMTRGVEQADGSIRTEATMDVEHVARAISYMASLPPDANVQFLTILPREMPFIGRG